jgi:serine/threonine protein kinase/pimeloyl-ACP methyl ester carboxylesterase/tetratricopeptide (TPR) repeat protein
MEQQIHFCTTHDGVRIAYATVGAGPPLVKAANWLSHLEFDWRSPVWRHLLAEFARDHTFIRYDERGNGLSDWKVADLSFDAWVEDVESVVEAAGVDRFPLLGISQGGAVAIAYAVRHPEKVSHLILYGAYARGWAKRESADEIEQRQAQLTLVRLGWGKDNPAFRQLWTTLYAPDATPEQAQSFNDLQRVSTSAENAVALLNVMGNIDVVDLLSQVKVPTLVLHCRDEAGVPFEEGRLIASSIPDARFVPLEGRNHLLLEGDPSWGLFVKEVRRFLGTEETSALTQVSDSGKPSPPNLQRSDLPARYSIISFLGVGGMGEVYLAEDTKLGRKVALKTLPAEFTNDKERLRRFQNEARAASALNHPNLLTIHEIGAESGAHFIAAEYIDGDTLRTRLKKGRMKIDDALDVAQQTAFALTAAHGAGILHRDIKPENIMVRHDGIVKVLDFGLAKLLEDHAREMIDHEADTRALVLTDPGRVLGTPAYMSPEQARGQDLDARTDIWSLGVVLYEMVAGRAPFRGETKSHTVVSILETEPAPLATFAPDAPAELQRIVRKALTKDRDSRYQTARDLMIDLKSLRRDLDIQSEMQRSSAPSVSGADSVDDQQVAAKVSADALSEQATSLDQRRPTRSDGHIPEGSIRYRIGALVAMLLLAVGALSLWYFQRQNTGAPINSIAVMPFVNATGNNDLEYLSEGMTESLITSLSQLPKLSVKARSSVFRYQGKDASPQEVGKALNVQAIVNGRVVQRGNELTLHIELVDVNTETALWSGDYNRSMTDLASLQSEIARDVSTKLQLKLSGADQQKLAKNYTANTAAYDLYLKGRFHWNKRTSEEIKQAIDYFNQAIEVDPSYALAYTGLADCYNLQGLREIAPDDAFTKAKAAALKALEIDDSLAEAHTSLGFVKHRYDWDWPGADKEFRRALELNPNYSTAHQWYAFYFATQGRPAESIAEIKRALELDPLSLEINADVGVQYVYARQADLAIEALRKTVALDEGFAYTHYMLGRAYQIKGMYPEAVKEAQRAVDLGGRSARLVGYLGQAEAAAGRQAEARKTLDELSKRSKQSYVSPLELALIYIALNEKEKAIAELQLGYEEHSSTVAFLKVDFRFDPLRSDPRFVEIVRRARL